MPSRRSILLLPFLEGYISILPDTHQFRKGLFLSATQRRRPTNGDGHDPAPRHGPHHRRIDRHRRHLCRSPRQARLRPHSCRAQPTAPRIAGAPARQRDRTPSVETVEADLTSTADLQRVEQILKDNAGISMLVNNAGVGSAAPARRLRRREDVGHDPPQRRRVDAADLSQRLPDLSPAATAPSSTSRPSSRSRRRC